MQSVIPLGHNLPECLTANNWQDVGVSSISYDLTSLLIKPGFDCLMQLTSLADFLAFTGNLVVNVTQLSSNKHGNYRLRSSLDGSQVDYSLDQLLLVIAQMKANIVLFPEGFGHQSENILDKMPSTTRAFFSSQDKLTNSSHGVYFNFPLTNDAQLLEDWFQSLNEHALQPRYVLGDINPDWLERLSNVGIDYCEIAYPVQDALEGKVYSSTGLISIASEAAATNFNVIDTDCACPTCQQLLTQAYLHHIFLHVPLLCQRLLIQHNVFIAQKGVLGFRI